MDLEDRADHAHETIREHVAAGAHHPAAPGWFTHVALSTLLMALLSASGALMAAISAHESLLTRSQEILDFVRLETDRLEIEVLKSKHAVLLRLDEDPDPTELARVDAYRGDAADQTAGAAREESSVRATTQAHLVFAIAVTLLSIGITLGGMAMIARKRFLWLVGLVFGAAGTSSLLLGLRDMF